MLCHGTTWKVSAMHGLVNRSIQLFVCHTYNCETWVTCTEVARIGFSDFEGMMLYEENYTARILDAMTQVLDRPRADLMEDFGTFLVSHPQFEPVRRLLRFGGVDFVEFLHSLDDLDDRARLALANLTLPKIELHPDGEGHFKLLCDLSLPGYSYVMMGVLRAMADDYGALVLLNHMSFEGEKEVVSIRLVANHFAEGRQFVLGGYIS